MGGRWSGPKLTKVTFLFFLNESVPKNDVISMTVNVPSIIVITGDGTMPRGECLGLYLTLREDQVKLVAILVTIQVQEIK